MHGINRIGKIYIITNDVTDKVYIGQTIQSIETRFKQHIWESLSGRRQSKLYKAMREIGFEHFNIDLIEECDEVELNNKEIYYIKEYDSFNNGYNSNAGGSSGSNGGALAADNMDIDKFIEMYNSGAPVVEIAAYFNFSVKTVHAIKTALNLDNTHGKFGEYSNAKLSGKPRAIIKYDTYFNAIKYYKTIKEAVTELNGKGSHYYYIRESCLRGNIAYGCRWQYVDDLVGSIDGKEIYFNTIFDKRLYNNGNKDIIKLKSGLYQVRGIDYTEFVGKSAGLTCSIHGNKLDNSRKCNKRRVEYEKRIKEANDSERIEQISYMISQGKNLTQIGNEFGVSANAIKGYCTRHNIDYSSIIHKNPEIVYVVNTKNGADAVINRLDLYTLLSKAGICELKTPYNFYGHIERICIKQGKTLYGYNIQYTDREDFHICDGFLIDPRSKSEIIRYYPDNSTSYIDFNTWDDVEKYLKSLNITDADKNIIRKGIKQAIKIRNGRRFSGTWQIFDTEE